MTRNYTEPSPSLFPPVLMPEGEIKSSVPFALSIVNEQAWLMLHPSQSSATRWALWRRNLSFAATAIGIFCRRRLMAQAESGWQLEASAPELYERYMVPGIAGLWAADLVERAAPKPGERVLDVACGTGIV